MEEDEIKMQHNATEISPSEALPAPMQPIPKWRERLNRRYPDRKFADDTEAENTFYEDYDNDSRKLEEAELNNKQVYELIEANPVLAEVVVAMSQGVPFEVALAQSVDLEALMPTNGQTNYEPYQKAVNERKGRAEESRKRMETIENNRKQSSATAQEFYEKKKMDDTEVNGFVDFVDGLLSGVFNGDVSRQTLEKLYQAYKYEEDIQDALTQGEINGRNANIEAKREKNAKTDGTPTPGTSITAQIEKPQEKQIFKLK